MKGLIIDMNYYEEIKNELIDVEVYNTVKEYSKNRYTSEKYYNVGKMIIEAQGGEERAKYGDGLIKEYAVKLVKEVDKKYDITTLKRIRQFYLMIQKGATMWHQLSWSHYRELLPINNINMINYYINICINQSLSVRDLKEKIKNKEYDRLTNETKLKLATKEDITLMDNIKNPIVIKNKYDTNIISEKMLKELILDNIETFMNELGEGFCYIGNEYKIKLGVVYNYIDILLYNIKYNCYVVVELKVTELKKEHIGQIQVYMNYIDENVKTIYQDKTIGIIVAKHNNKYVIRYSSNPKVVCTEFELV